jgi:hypothetical protein
LIFDLRGSFGIGVAGRLAAIGALGSILPRIVSAFDFAIAWVLLIEAESGWQTGSRKISFSCSEV